ARLGVAPANIEWAGDVCRPFFLSTSVFHGFNANAQCSVDDASFTGRKRARARRVARPNGQRIQDDKVHSAVQSLPTITQHHASTSERRQVVVRVDGRLAGVVRTDLVICTQIAKANPKLSGSHASDQTAFSVIHQTAASKPRGYRSTGRFTIRESKVGQVHIGDE